MSPHLALIILLTLTSSCGGFHFLDNKANKADRQIATATIDDLLNEENLSFSAEIDEKLRSLHCYYVLGQKNLLLFDGSLKDLSLIELYQSAPYLGLIAIRTQVEEIENELITLAQSSKGRFASKRTILTERIEKFKQSSPLAFYSMANISEALEMENHLVTKDVRGSDVDKELKMLEGLNEFIIYEKNIEHLSHLMNLKLKAQKVKTFSPSEQEKGNVTGQEFPEKVWALTFDNGPSVQNTPKVLENLKLKNLKATFFQVTNKAKLNLETSKLIRDAGMEIGSHSYTNKDLNRVGRMTLDKEITLATKELEKDLKIDIQFYRLPFGSGARVPAIRQMIASNNLIHAFWNVDTLDWMAQTPLKIVERTKILMQKTPQDAGVILFHDTHFRGAEASLEIMEHLNKNGRRACTLGRIIKEMNEETKTVCSKN